MTDPDTTAVCAWCDEDLDDDPYSHEDAADVLLCRECYYEAYMFECCRCDEYESIDVQHRMLVVVEEVRDVRPGIYRIVKFPYEVNAIIGAYLIGSALDRIGNVPADVDTGGLPCGHLCAECQAAVQKETNPNPC